MEEKHEEGAYEDNDILDAFDEDFLDEAEE